MGGKPRHVPTLADLSLLVKFVVPRPVAVKAAFQDVASVPGGS